MRRIVALTLIGFTAATPLAAQFEGTVSMKLMTETGSAGEVNMKVLVKGDRSATVMAMPASAGPMAGSEVRSIFDPKANTMTMLMPIPPGMANMPGMANAKGIKSVVDLSKTQMAPGRSATAGDIKADIKKLGTSQTIAGLSCDDYEVTPANDTPVRMCVTSALGRFAMPRMGGMGGRGASSTPVWAHAFGNRPMFPLKVWSTDGKMAMEVTSVQKGSVPESAFEIPDDYMDMGGMMGGRMGRPPLR